MSALGGLFPGIMTFAVGLISSGRVEVDAVGTLGAVAHVARLRLGGANLIVGAGAPSGDPGTVPVVYIRSDPASAATVIYVCHTGSTWTAIS